jgi:LCP family protein required for cell wall assembly
MRSEGMRQYYPLVPNEDDSGRDERPDYPVYRAGGGERPARRQSSGRASGSSTSGAGKGEEPEYTVYRSRRRPLAGLRAPSVGALRDRLGRGGGRPPRGDAVPGAPRPLWRRVLRWALIAAGLWLALSVVLFAISAQIQKSKLADGAKDELGGFPLLVAAPQTILVMGTDARPEGTVEAGADTRKKCLEQGSRGEAPRGGCPGYRADTLMLVRAGGGAFRKLSIPRDTFAAIPGAAAQKINAAYAIGGAKLQIQTVEDFLGIDINHAMILDFEGFADFIDALGGVTVDLDQRVKSKISGGSSNGGITLKLPKGESTLDGQRALALARTRQNLWNPAENDLDRARRQQLIISGIKDRLTSPWRLPINFIRGPWIAWTAPRTMVSDMGAFVMPQLPIAAAIGGDESPQILEPSAPGPGGSLSVPLSECESAVEKLLGHEGPETPACSPL